MNDKNLKDVKKANHEEAEDIEKMADGGAPAKAQEEDLTQGAVCSPEFKQGCVDVE